MAEQSTFSSELSLCQPFTFEEWMMSSTCNPALADDLWNYNKEEEAYMEPDSQLCYASSVFI